MLEAKMTRHGKQGPRFFSYFSGEVLKAGGGYAVRFELREDFSEGGLQGRHICGWTKECGLNKNTIINAI